MDTSMFHHKKVIIFDMDSTLIDSVGARNEVDAALIQHLRGCPIPTSENCLDDSVCHPDPTAIQRQRDRLLCQFNQAPIWNIAHTWGNSAVAH